MKQKVFLGIVSLMMTIGNVSAQELGWYRMTQYCGEDGKYVSVPDDWNIWEYKDEENMIYYRIDDNHSILFDNEVKYTYWFETISDVKKKLNQLPKKKSNTRSVIVCETTDYNFQTLRNNSLSKYANLPHDSWVKEVWTKAEPSVTIKTINELIYYIDDPINRLKGVWNFAGFIVSGKIKKSDIWMNKVYGDDFSTCIIPKETFNGCLECQGTIHRIEYLTMDVIRENGKPCIITWIDSNTHRLTYINDDGVAVEEVWER